ncbi:uncharacterized protein [Lolium perenne]|uniref:uncharacterized protein isoform X2 n=1 Tax=Lolium perenne TaxID=4522 RepID=UPI0021EA3FFE|nr:uncharacterized protein LOC127333791 isoform X2 [Lolium perenne]
MVSHSTLSLLIRPSPTCRSALTRPAPPARAVRTVSLTSSLFSFQVGHIGCPATAGADLDTITTMEVTPPALLPLPSAQIWPSASDISQRTMAKSSARKETAPARPPATLPQQHMFPGAPSSSSANPSTPQHLYPHGSSYTNPLNQWARGEEQKQ